MSEAVSAAARFVSLGLRPKVIPVNDQEYSDLVEAYLSDAEFAELVVAICLGLELRVLAVTRQSGIILAPIGESVFALSFTEYYKRSSMKESSERVLHGLAHLALAALAFPTPDNLSNDSYVGYITVLEVDEIVRDACRVLSDRAKVNEELVDPSVDLPELEHAWHGFMRRPSYAATKSGQLSTDSTQGIITKAAKFLVDQGFLVPRADQGEGSYRTTARYQIQVRELASTSAFQELLRLGVVQVPEAQESLRVVETNNKGLFHV